ncbi:Acylphosphatase [Decorospora gaudefroyi]|uniref:acylphosphatase n=1 Tax=Decorospora gaudefroyi TaxID=184978 RepID=A0A6A5K7E3_9PLEO|nr:Acylphosphatase [Decorospora gaudefroyi]
MHRFFSSTARIMTTKRISYQVGGEVQGVNFRSFTQKQAKSIGITGFVSNASDGTVTGEAQGSEDKLKEFVQHLNKGPSAASVHQVEQKDIDTKSGESSFDVK